MAKDKNKKKSPFSSRNGGKDGRRADSTIDLTNRGTDDSDSDLDISSLLRKYMPEFQDNEESDQSEDGLSADLSQTGPGPEEPAADDDAEDLFAALGLDSPDTGETDADAADSLFPDDFADSLTLPEDDGTAAGGEPEKADEADSSGISGFADRIAAAMESGEGQGEDMETEEPVGGLFSRFLRTTEEAAEEPASDASSVPAGETDEEGGVFSRIRRTVEDEESRREEQMRSDEELLSALDAAFAYPPEDNGDGGDFQVPLTATPATPAPPAPDEVIREYDIDGESGDGGTGRDAFPGKEPPVEGLPAESSPGFTVSDTRPGLTEDDREIDFGPEPHSGAEYAGQPGPGAGKPVGEEMTDEQVAGLFSEVKPQRKRFSLFRRNKKPKVAAADDEFLPDDGGDFGTAAAPFGGPAPSADETGPAIVPDEPAPSGAEEIPRDTPGDDTDDLIAQATAALFGDGQDTESGTDADPGADSWDGWTDAPDTVTGAMDSGDAQFADELGEGDSSTAGSVDDEIEALWRQAAAAVDAETDGGVSLSDDGTTPAEEDAQSVGEADKEAAPATGVSSGWARLAEKAMQAADSEDLGSEVPAFAENGADVDEQMLEDAAAALQSAAQEHSVTVSEEMGTVPAAPAQDPSAPVSPSPAPVSPAGEDRKKRTGRRPFIRQSKRSAANLSDEELMQWAAQTLAETQSSQDFGPAEDYPEEDGTEETPFAQSDKAVADVGEEIPDVSAFEDAGGDGITAESSLSDLKNYRDAGKSSGEPGSADSGEGSGASASDAGGEGGSWQTPDTPYVDEELDPTDINLMVAFDLDDGKNGKSGKAKALGDKLAARQQNRDTAVRLDRPEFVDRTQIPTIRKEYEKHSLSLFIRLILCVVFGALLFLYENIEPVTKLLTGTGMQFSGVLDPRVYPAVYAMVSLQLMLFCCLCAYEEIIAGVKAVFTGIPKPESMTGLLALAGILYSSVIARVTEAPEEPKMFNFLVGLACFMTLISAVYQNKREMMNFRIISSRKLKHIVRRLKDDESELETQAFAEAEDACDVMKIEKTDFIDGFFARLQKPDTTTGVFMMFVMGATVLLAVIIGIVDRVRGGTSANVARVIYESLLMMAPLSVFISFSYPFYRANLTAKDYDSAIIGETSLEEYSNASIISFDDKNVFPSLSVKVQNVRIYNNARIDRILYYASSVFAYAGGPLQDVFEDVTKDLGTSSNVKIFETEDEFLATQVDGVNIIFGGCEKLRSRGFVIDDEAAEDDVDLSDELSIMYMFRENKLVAKMYIKYEMDPDIDSILKQFSGNGLYACVRTFDPNINEEMVAKKLSMKKMPLKIVRYANLDEVATYEAKVDSGLVTCGQQKSLLQVIAYCGKVLRTKKTHIALSVLAILVSAAIVLILELAGMLPGMNSWLVTLYQLVWLIPTLITSRVFIR